MGTWHRDRDEDLTLFHDMRARERNNFLHPSNDDIEASLSTKFGGLSAYRFGGSTPTHKGSGDLLVLDAEKSDYNWLLTPPGTPLFPSLDQDIPIIRLSQRGGLTRSTSASKTSRLPYPQEPSSKLHRGNLSPRRPGTATSTSSTTSTNRGRSSSPSITSSSPILRSSSPSCRPTTPTRRTSVTSRSWTPDVRRTNTSPVMQSSSVSKAGSTSAKPRGKSMSPKLRPWEPSMPGFSSEPPPNLRTSLSDCSTQRTGSRSSIHAGTAAARNSYSERSESSRPRRQSATSPDPFRSLSSNQDYTSSQTSKGSVISSCDDDTEMAESVASASTKTSSEAASRKENPSIGRSVLPAKRQIRPAASEDKLSLLNVTPKRLSERQVDRHRSSQSMFRPLLSSIPASSFYSTRAAGMHHGPTSSVLGSSITMNSNERTERGVKISPENEMNHGDEEKKDSTRAGPCLEKSANFVGNDDEHMNADGMTRAHARYHFSSLGGQEMKDSEGEISTSIEDLKDQVQSSSETEEAKETIKAQVFVDKFEKHTHGSDDSSFSVDLGDPAHISESKILEANGVQRMPNKILCIERSGICMGRDLSMEKREMLQGATFPDARDVSEINSSLQFSAASVCDFQSNFVYQRPVSTEDTVANDTVEHASEHSSDRVVLDALLEKTLSCYSDSFAKEDIIFSDTEMVSEEQLVLEMDSANLDTTAQDTVDIDTVAAYYKLPAKEDVVGDKLSENSAHDEAVAEDIECPDVAPKKQQPGPTLLKRNVTLEEATDTILFCNSLVHGIVYGAAAIAIQREDDALIRNSEPKREHITLFGSLKEEHRNTARHNAPGPGNWKQEPAGSAIQRTFKYVQKRRMVHQQTPTVILQQSPMDRTENAIIGNQEEDLTHTILKNHQEKPTQKKTVDSRCSCSIM